MVWRYSAVRHLSSIGGFARWWLGGGLLDRFVVVTLLGWLWASFWFTFALMSQSPGFIIFVFLFICPVPWVLLLVDAWLDARTVQADIASFAAQNVILATRCEYLGGHPQLPHGRFAYLTLEGTRQNPLLNLVFPRPHGLPWERFPLPLLDLKKTKPEKGSDDSLAADIAASINKDVGRFLRPERLKLVIDYAGYGDRTHKVELTNFFRGNDEIRNWRNYLVCAQAESDTGVVPHEPWISLPNEPQAPSPHALVGAQLSDPARNGHEDRQPSSAFSRR
jgi:hypothetical protein